MRLIKKRLNKKERQFCEYVAGGYKPLTAAELAGDKKGQELDAQRLMCEERILDEIDRLITRRKSTMSRMAAVGYEKLAFGDISDAVELLYLDSPSERKLKSMDLFMVSEIKKPKDGMLEIKFFDRLKALERLSEDSRQSVGPKSLYEAIGRQAERLGGEGSD